jgi:hypothetical protein
LASFADVGYAEVEHGSTFFAPNINTFRDVGHLIAFLTGM